MKPLIVILLVIAGIFALAVMFVLFNSIKLFFQSWFSGAKVGLVRIILMPIRKINNSLIVNNYIFARKAGLDMSVEDLETHYLAQGNVNRVVRAMVAANKANIDLDFKRPLPSTWQAVIFSTPSIPPSIPR